jgi:uncharacterized membrane protein (UPF0127 family)
MNKVLQFAFMLLALWAATVSGTSGGRADGQAMYLPTDSAPLVMIGDDGIKREFSVEIADTPDERAKGLMFRPALAPDHGMLFVFPYTREVSFWMENTPQALDLVFIDAEGHVAAVMQGQPLSRAIIDPQVPVRFVLELAAGVASRSGIRHGTLLIHPVIENAVTAGTNQ